ncbi:MAG TPA: S9 family peptidase [Gemmatimonadales bacterium]|jgi:oligopeptidase B|nr:S9 family peptidase [Gemmatimonadales bacterium]
MPEPVVTPPVALRRAHPIVLHGERLQDDYFWLRDRDDPAVRAYLEAENAYADAVLAPTRQLQQTLYDEMLGRIKQTDVSVPYRDGAFWYYARTEEGRQYPIYSRKRESLTAPEQILLDLNQLAQGHRYMAVGAFAVSDDGRLLAYSTDATGYREYTLVVQDLERGAMVAGPIAKCGSVAWAADNRTFFYTIEDVAKRFYQVWREEIGGSRELVLEESDERFRLQVERARSRRYLVLQADSHTTSELQVVPAELPRSPPRLLLPRVADRELEADHLGEGWLLRVNDTGPNFRIVQFPEHDPDPARWVELVPQRDDVMVEAVDAFAGHWVAWERAAGLVEVRVTDRASGKPRYLTFPESVYEAGSGPNAEWHTATLRYEYESPVTPPSVYDYDVATGESTLLKQQEIPGGFDAAKYGCERRAIPAPDGTPIPVSLMFRRDPPVARPAPLLLTGYGAYGISFPVSFSSNRLSLLDRGVMVAIAHGRGGGELGKRWHDAGRMAVKRNSFTDFVAVAEALVREGLTEPSRLASEGGSAGGLLVAAAANLRPELFGTVVAQVPFVDVINTMLDPSLPLTVGEYEEWGNPALPEQYAWLRDYCPYTNLTRRAYPAMLVRTSLNDSQVMFWEPAKYVARLRTLKTDANPLLVLTNLGAGHGGASGRYDRLREVALDYAFLLWRLGVWQERQSVAPLNP